MNKLAVCGGALLALVGTSALAVPGLANVNQKGSLLIFPEIDVSEGRDTLIFLSNDYTTAVEVKCYYGEFARDRERSNPSSIEKPTQDFQFTVTRNQPLVWFASNGTGSGPNLPNFPNQETGTGQLVCWAVSRGGGYQIKHNHLSGMAKIIQNPFEGVGEIPQLRAAQSYEYSAYAFYCNGAAGAGRALTGDPCGEIDTREIEPEPEPGVGALMLDEKAYDQCGRYIIGQMIPTGTGGTLDAPLDVLFGPNYNFLSISSCTQDLSPVGEADYIGHDLVIDVWNADEVKFTGAKEDDVDSWWRFSLGPCASFGEFDFPFCRGYDQVDVNRAKLTFNELKTIVAHYRMESTEGYGLVGVQTQWHFNAGWSATTVRHAGKAKGEILWRTQFDSPPERQ